MVFLDWDDSSTEDSETLATFLGQRQSEAERAEQRAKADEFIRKILSGDVDDQSGPYKLRAIVEHDRWYVPVKDNGRFELLNVAKGQYERLICDVSKKDGRRTERKGKGGQFLPVYCQEPAAMRTICVDGRTLARSLPVNVTGLLIQNLDEDTPRELSSEFFPQMVSLADSVEIEDVLLADGPVDAAKLRSYQWLVDMVNDERVHLSPSIIEGAVATIFTHHDREYGTEHHPPIKMDGTTIFRRILNDAQFDGIVINSYSTFGRCGKSVQNMLLSLSFLQRALDQDTCHLRVKDLTARSRAEFELWLYINSFPTEREIIEETDANGQRIIYAVSKQPVESWREQECCGLQDAQMVSTPKFIIQPAPDSKPGFGKGASSILCPGLLARELYVRPPKGKQTIHNWRPGRKMIVGRLLSEEDINDSLRRLTIAHELLKLVPAGANRVPRSAMLTVVGADFVRRVPYCCSRAWIETEIEEAERYSRKWVWG